MRGTTFPDLSHVLVDTARQFLPTTDPLMPTYKYRREDGSTFEVQQRITEDPLETCPETGQDVERIITDNPGVIFRGEGFHVNDYDEHGPKQKGSSKEDGTGSEDTEVS